MSYLESQSHIESASLDSFRFMMTAQATSLYTVQYGLGNLDQDESSTNLLSLSSYKTIITGWPLL